ncbi:MAG: valine--tRNA ligase [Candidatus Lloydbacteria bacterium CG22_combo_CG10-13_8_21_14_all_47_15]|uniref:Valine--tRNA ligase n=1 Tax=Candidatus Lloydbacteria bacterium CG22_combo_CG10-13_8_21_14_all_47_15 TaxID=1974635 RepID=A0A2H0CTI7_9BACT|nr:MAG: valine--tRNA ligase [Candidatus Lloydbacteria bacterium CG22_combo_CG10-13_8_21_14_all_47_15]
MDEKFLKPYDPKKSEDTVYKRWEESGFFKPEKTDSPDGERFSIVLPPPNVTGTLHMGHAAMLAIEDIAVRFERMSGKQTLWLPGTDHAAIATQSKVEEIMYKKEKKTRHDIGREEFLRRVDAYAKESHDTIVNQIKKMGASVDWSREAFTLDEARHRAVNTAFKKMYDDGLIYRGEGMVNWDPKLQTTVSDDEIEWDEETVPFYYLKYGPFIIGTSRPETKFGDKYVVMHPDDTRYSEYTDGQTIKLEWINGPISATIIKDTAIDMEFGTGVMTITPWHDRTDFEIAERHDLDKEQVINERGILLPIAGEFAGEHIKKARARIVEKLRAKGLVDKVDEKYVHSIAINSRGGGIIEPQIKEQWFVAVNKEFPIAYSAMDGIASGETVTLKKLMRHAVESGQIKIIPDRFEKIYYHWIDNLRDWNISRQIWYGHRIPVWYHDPICIPLADREDDISKCIPIVVSGTKPECKFCAAAYTQDPDTLDTWFSSGLWTFSTLGWPDETADLKRFHPTDLLETGYDILFFWVARMILMTTYLLGDVPFRTVYLHGLVRDEKGKKMSKSLGNTIDPLEMIEKYGADATRLSLVVGAPPGNDISLSEGKVRGYKHFANKIWNIARFVLSNIPAEANSEKPALRKEDNAWIESLVLVSEDISKHIAAYRFDLASDILYHWVWHEFADKYIEEVKPALKDGTDEEKASVQWTLYAVLTDCLKLLHPFMPFVTEEIWAGLPRKDAELLMIAPWPTVPSDKIQEMLHT